MMTLPAFICFTSGPIALRALCQALKEDAFLPSHVQAAGLVLVAPAVLDPEEDPDAYNSDDSTPTNTYEVPLSVRISAFRAVLALPDAFSVMTAQRLANRDLREALLNQTHASMGLPDKSERLMALVDKYAAPVNEYPNEWDTALINVYRADFGARDDASTLRGRKLLSEALAVGGGNVCVLTGDDDRVVPVRATRRVAELLGVKKVEEMLDTGHLPMDERPDEFAKILLRFMVGRDRSGA